MLTLEFAKLKTAIGKQKIARYLTNILASRIAVIPAFVVSIIHIKSIFILWIYPTKIITPIVFW